jgi:hypothetical protein
MVEVTDSSSVSTTEKDPALQGLFFIPEYSKKRKPLQSGAVP